MAKIDLKDLTKDVKLDDVLGDLRDAFSDRVDPLMGAGRGRARRALGAHDDTALFAAFTVGMLVGALIGAAVALLMTPVSGAEARRKLGEGVGKVRGPGDTGWDATASGNGRSGYQTPAYGAATPPYASTPER